MSFTIYSFLMTVITSNITMLILFLCCRSAYIISKVSLNFLLFASVLCLIRPCLPFEFKFTKEVPVPGILNPIYDTLKYTIAEKIELWQILAIVWVFVSLFLLVRLLRMLFKMEKLISKMNPINKAHVYSAVRKVIPKQKQKKIRVVSTSPQETPMAWKNTIILPNRKYTNGELEVILLHEYAHVRNHDTYIKLIIEFLSVIFWWYPALYFFKHSIGSILEMRCDMQITKGKNKGYIIQYLEILAKEAELSIKHNSKKDFATQTNLSGDNELIQRVKILAKYSNKKQKMAIVALSFMLSIILFVVSYLFVLQSHYELPLDNINGNYGVMLEKYEIIDNQDGTYTVWGNGNQMKIPKEEVEELIKQ